MPLTRLSLEERIRLVRLYSMYEKATHIQKAWKKEFQTDPPSRKTIAALNKKFDQTGSVADLSRSGRPKSSRTEEKVALVQAALKKDPSRSIRSLSTELGVNKAAVHRIKQESEKKKSVLGAEIRRLKERIADLQRRLDTTDNKNSIVPAAVAVNTMGGQCMASMEQYIMEKQEMFQHTIIETIDDDDENHTSDLELIPVTRIRKMDLENLNNNVIGEDATEVLLATHNLDDAGDTESQAVQLTETTVIQELELPDEEVQDLHGSSVADIKTFEALGHQDLHHPNNCPDHPMGCHMCYITNAN